MQVHKFTLDVWRMCVVKLAQEVTQKHRGRHFSCSFHNVLTACFTTGSWIEKSQFLLKLSCQNNLFSNSWFALHNRDEYINTRLPAQTLLQGSSNSVLEGRLAQTLIKLTTCDLLQEVTQKHRGPSLLTQFSQHAYVMLHDMLMFTAGWQIESNGFIV